jgi:histidinol-phosphate/aromatic aminotransferase/cobyric acid decarboxylase-like protein
MAIALADRIRAEELKEQIRVLVREQADIAARFANYDSNSETERRAAHLAFVENRVMIGRLSQELLRLVCI